MQEGPAVDGAPGELKAIAVRAGDGYKRSIMAEPTPPPVSPAGMLPPPPKPKNKTRTSGNPPNPSPSPPPYLAHLSAVVDFFEYVGGAVGGRYRQARTYRLLLQKTGIAHRMSIERHVAAVRRFAADPANAAAVAQRRADLFAAAPASRIQYSESVFVCLRQVHAHVLALGPGPHLGEFWARLAALLAGVREGNGTPGTGNGTETGSGGGGEEKFLAGLLDRLQASVPRDVQDPMAAMSSLMGSGALSSIMAEMDHKVRHERLDMGRLLQSAIGMLGSSGPPGPGTPAPEAAPGTGAAAEPAEKDKDKDPAEAARAAALAAVERAGTQMDPAALLDLLSGLPGGARE